MKIWTPYELGVGKPLIGSNHMHSIARREGDETSMLVECNGRWILGPTIEGRDVMAFVSECLQSMIFGVGDDDSALVGDAQSSKVRELACLIAFGAELEQERAIDRRQYLHSMINLVAHDDSISIIIDRNACWAIELARLRSSLADLEQEREIDRRQERQSIVEDIGDDDAMMMFVDCNAERRLELEGSRSTTANARQKRLLAQ